MSVEAKNWQWQSIAPSIPQCIECQSCCKPHVLHHLACAGSLVDWVTCLQVLFHEMGMTSCECIRGTYSTYSTCTYRRLGFSDCLKPQLSIGTISRVQWKSTRDLLSFRFDNETHWATQLCRWQSTPCQEIEFEWFWNIEAVRCSQTIAPSMISTLLEEDPEITFNAGPSFSHQASPWAFHFTCASPQQIGRTSGSKGPNYNMISR